MQYNYYISYKKVQLLNYDNELFLFLQLLQYELSLSIK